MSKDSLIKIRDNEDGKTLEFTTLQKACDYMQTVTGKNITPSTLFLAIKRCGSVLKGRFNCCNQPDGLEEPGKARVYKEDGWEYTQYPKADTVLIAESNLDWYDTERMKEVNQHLKANKCRAFWDMEKAKRNHTRVEIYRKFPENTPFKDKVLVLKGIISEINFLK